MRPVLTLAFLLVACPARQSAEPDAAAPAEEGPSAPAREDSGPPWPELPRTTSEAAELMGDRASREPTELTAPDLAPAAIMALPHLRGLGTVVAGMPSVAQWIDGRLDAAEAEGARSSVILVGTYHDSVEQIRLFRRLVGPRGVPDVDHVVVEHFRADGRWRGVPASDQVGDDAAIDSYLETGEGSRYSSLSDALEGHAYTAWRYGATAELMDLVVQARASGQRLSGCDMPPSLLERAAAEGEGADRLRELHCLLATRAGRRPGRAAMLWGMDHVEPTGVRRMVPAGAHVLSLYVVGGRPGALSPEAVLAERLVVNDLVLLPLDDEGEQAVLLLPGSHLGGSVDRSRDEGGDGSSGEATLAVRSELPGTLLIADRRLAVGPGEATLSMPPGAHGYVLVGGSTFVVGALEAPSGAAVEVHFDPAERSTRVISTLPAVGGSS